MSRTPRLTDAVLRAALLPAAEVAVPAGMLASIGDDIRHTSQERSPLRVHGFADLADRLGPRPTRRLVLVLAAAGLLAALLGGALVAGRLFSPLFAPPRVHLVPTAIETLAPDVGFVDRVVVDGVGAYWAIGPGRLTSFDLGMRMRRTWTVSDDAVFDTGIVAPAGAGGVWIWSSGTIRRFDGERFVETVPGAAATPMALVEGPDGSLWASSAERGLERWDGEGWVPAPAGRPSTRAIHVLPLGPDEVWVDNPSGEAVEGGGPAGAGVSNLVDGRWITYDRADAMQLGGTVGALEQAADGSIWVANESSVGIGRFDGQTWTTVPGPGFPAWWLEAAPDGSMWAVTANAATLEIARYRDGAWTTYGADDGLAGSELGHVSATPAGVFLGTDAGLFVFIDGRWTRVWSDERPASGWGDVIAVSRDEAWVAGGGIRHLRGRSWEGPLLPPGLDFADVRALALGPGGELWAATDGGVAVLRDGRWTIASAAAAWAIAVGADGTAWIGGEANAIIRLSDAGDRYVAETIACPVHPTFLVTATDGSVYLGDFVYTSPAPGLARFDGRSCEILDPFGDGSMPSVVGLAAHPDGGVVALLLGEPVGGTVGPTWSSHLARVDGTSVTMIEELSQVDGAGAFAVAPNGDIWRRSWSRPGLERFDGERWITIIDGVEVAGPIAVAPDGAVYFFGPSGLQRFIPPVEP